MGFLKTFTRYNLWANKRIAEVLDQLDPVAYDQPVKSSFPTIRVTAFHIWDAEYIWLQRLTGSSPRAGITTTLPAETKPADFVKGSEAFLEFLEKKDEAFFRAITTYRNIKGDQFSQPNDELIMHCMNHSTFHRGQLVTMIRETGFDGKLPATDLVVYFRENAQISS